MMLPEERLAAYKSIYVPDNFGIFDEEEFDSEEYQFFCDSVHEINVDAEVRHGISKAVVNDPDLDVVVKVPFFAIYYDVDGEFDENGTYQVTEIDKTPIEENYCELEAFIYNEMPSEFKIFFAETIELDESHYIQEKCVAYEDINENYATSKKKLEEYNKKYATKFSHKGRLFTASFMLDLIKTYGEQKVYDFLAFLYEDELIGGTVLQDMHVGNYGYRKSDGTPCIIDYSGWSE